MKQSEQDSQSLFLCLNFDKKGIPKVPDHHQLFPHLTLYICFCYHIHDTLSILTTSTAIGSSYSRPKLDRPQLLRIPLQNIVCFKLNIDFSV